MTNWVKSAFTEYSILLYEHLQTEKLFINYFLLFFFSISLFISHTPHFLPSALSVHLTLPVI